MGDQKDYVDIIESAAPVAPTGATRLRRRGGTLQSSTDGSVFAALGGAAALSPFYTRMKTLQESLVTLTGQRWQALGVYPAGVAIASRTNNQTQMSGGGVIATATALALTNNMVQTPKTLPWFVGFRAKITGAFAGAQYAMMGTHDGTNDYVRFGYAGGFSNSFFMLNFGHGGVDTNTPLTAVALDTAVHDHAFYFDGSTAGRYYIDGVLATTISDLTNFPTTAQSVMGMANTNVLTVTETYYAFNES